MRQGSDLPPIISRARHLDTSLSRLRDVMIIAVLGEKGGTGKTTFATNLAGMRAAAGRDVLILDADRQGSASYWAEKREKHDVPSVTSVQKFGTGLMRAVSDMARRYGDIVIDIAAGDSREIEGALRS